MSDNLHNDTTEGLGASTPRRAGVLGAPISRRSVLFKGLGKGSAVLAAAVPIKTLAATPSVTDTGQICTISGVQSAVHSAATNLPTCRGQRPSNYLTIGNWPNYPNTTYTVGVKTFDQNSGFNTVFVGGMSQPLMTILKNFTGSNEYHWIAALLNAIKPPVGYVFPYSPQEILDLYAGAQQADALAFLKNYMETM